MNVRMLQTVRGKPDGMKQTFVYYQDKTYSPSTTPPMTPGLADVLIKGGLAEVAESEQGSPERKVVNPAPETAVTNPANDQANNQESPVETQAAGDETPTAAPAGDTDPQAALEQYKVPGGWYQLPGVDRKVRKAEALELLANQ